MRANRSWHAKIGPGSTKRNPCMSPVHIWQRDDLRIMLAFSDLSSKKFVGEKGAPEPATPTADRRYSTPQTTPSHRASQPPGHPPPTATDPTQSACAEVEFCARTSLSQPAARCFSTPRHAARPRTATPLTPATSPARSVPTGGWTTAPRRLVRRPAPGSPARDGRFQRRCAAGVQGNARGHARRRPPACLRWNPRRLRARL